MSPLNSKMQLNVRKCVLNKYVKKYIKYLNIYGEVRVQKLTHLRIKLYIIQKNEQYYQSTDKQICSLS